MTNIGLRLKEERERLGITQIALAKVGGVEKNAQSHYERGSRVPKADYLQSVASVGVDVCYVVTGIYRIQDTGQTSHHASLKSAQEIELTCVHLRQALGIVSQAISEVLEIIEPGSRNFYGACVSGRAVAGGDTTAGLAIRRKRAES